jgi:PIN domain nuclease of toxin-antitoxin system
VINLDTHILVFALAGRLTARERRIVEAETWGISAIVLWELAKLVQLGRLRLDLENGEVVRAFPRCTYGRSISTSALNRPGWTSMVIQPTN